MTVQTMKSSTTEGGQSAEERMAAFRGDPLLMEAATKFVNEVLEKAKEEATRRIKDRSASEQADSDHGVSMKRCRWPSRARGFFMRLLASLCLCNSEGNKGS